MKPEDDYNLDEKIRISFKGMPYYVMPRYKTHYVDNDYERFSLQLLKNDLKTGAVFVDIGAHYGAYSLYAAKAGSKVVAVEPVTENFQLLNQNVEVNNLGNLITTHNYAVSDKNGEAEFNIPWASDSAGFYEHPNAETIRKQKVTVRKADDLLTNTRVDVIKIDTEGHEISVLKGLRQTLKRNPQAKLIIELNPECLKRAGQTVEALLAAIAAYDKEVYIVDEDGFSLIRLSAPDDWKKHVEASGYANLYCVPASADHQFLLFVSHSPRLDGAERALADQVCALRDKGLLAHVVLPGGGPFEELLTDKGIGHSVVEGGYSFWVKPESSKNKADTPSRVNRMNIDASAAIAALAQRLNPTAIVNNTLVNPWGYAAARSNGLPLLWMIHEYGDLDHDMPFSHDLKAIRAFVVGESQLVFCCSDSVRKSLLAGDKQLDKKIHTSYNFMDQAAIAALAKAKIKPPFSSKGIARKLCIVGTIKEKKGQLLAIQAVHELKQQNLTAELLIIGEATKTYDSYLKDVVKKLGLTTQVKFLGNQPNPYPYMRAADAVLVCSNNEAFGRTTAEAMIIGTPVIGSNAGGTAEMITSTTGLLFQPTNVEDLVRQIKKLDQVDIAKLAKAAQARIKQLLDTDANAQRMTSLMRTSGITESAANYGKLINQEWADAINEHIAETTANRELAERLAAQEAERQQTTDRLATENTDLRTVNDKLAAELRKVLNSRSWKATKPLRAANYLKRKAQK